MKILVNGKQKNYPSCLTLEDLLIKLDQAGKKVAIEINDEIIPRSELKNKLVVDGDKVEIINAVGGG